MERDEQWVLDEKHGGTPGAAFDADKKRLAADEPVAYVIGHQPFLGLDIYLDSKPLIPRPETEWWTERLLETLASREPIEERAQRDGASQSKFPAGNYAAPKAASEAQQLRFLDLCAGSGAIGCAALARLPNAKVFFGEADPGHEATIRKNIRENGLDESRAFVGIGDLFAPFGDMTFDIIASNPPYVPDDRELPKSIADYEPAKAFYAGKDGLDFIRRIAAELPKRLTPDGTAWVECDREHAEEARMLFAAQGFSATVLPDQYGKPRVITVTANSGI